MHNVGNVNATTPLSTAERRRQVVASVDIIPVVGLIVAEAKQSSKIK